MSGSAALSAGEPNGRARPFGLFERTVAARYLRAKRAHGGVALISVISFIGIMLAVAVLIIVMSVMNGFRHDLLSRLLGAQGHVFVFAALSDQAETDALVERITAVPGVLRAAPVISGQAGVMGNDAFSGVMIYGLAHDDLQTLDIVRDGIRIGSIESFATGEQDGILIGSQLANRLGLTVGDPIVLLVPEPPPAAFGYPTAPRRKTFYIDAIFSVGMSQIDDLFVYMPIVQARVFLGRDEAQIADFIEVSIENPDDVDAARRRLQQELGGSVSIRDWRNNYASYVSALAVERNVMRLILGMLVLIAALNIISGLVMLAKNKSGDIAILRTVGATQGSIMRIFFLVGASIGIAGTVAGLLLGTLFCAYIGDIQHALEWLFSALTSNDVRLFPDDIYFLSQIPARIEWSEVAFVAAWGIIMSCVWTLPPAWNAARLDPVEALRYG